MIAHSLMGILLLSVPFISSSQSYERNYLRNYKSPEFKYRAWNIGSTGGNMLRIAHTDQFTRVNLNGRSTFFYRTNKHIYQGDGDIELNESLILWTNNLNSFEHRTSLRTSTFNRFYTRKNFFYGVHGVGSLSLRNSSATDAFNNTIRTRNYSINYELNLSFGYGRLEPVHYARRAMDITKVFEKELISEAISESELDELSHAVTRALNIRKFDYRKRNILQLEMLDSAITSFGKVKNKDAKYYGNLNDLIRYNFVFDRFSGLRHEYGLITDIDYQRLVFVDSVIDVSEILRPLVFVNFSNHIPNSYSFQNNFLISACFGLESIQDFGPQSFDEWYSNLTFGHQFGFYPNTRTHLDVSNYVSSSFTDEGMGLNIFSQLRAYFFISPRLRLDLYAIINLVGDYENSGLRTLNVPSDFFDANQIFQFSGGLRYSLF